MPENGNGASMAEDSGEYRQRVRGLERQQDVFSSQIANLSTRMDGQYSALSAKIDEKFGTIQQGQRPQWSNILAACSFTFALLSGLVTLITVPIFYQISDIKQTAKDTKTEFTISMARGRDERTLEIRDLRATLLQDIRDIREDLVPRKEHTSHQELAAAQLADLSRRVGEVRDDFKNIFSARDIITKLVNDVSSLQKELRDKEKN